MADDAVDPALTNGSELPAARPAPPQMPDPVQVLLQASAAAESLQERFAELQARRSELLAERRQLEADRTAFDQHAREFAASVARDRAAHRDAQAELDQRLRSVNEREQQLQNQLDEFRQAQKKAAEERVLYRQTLQSELDEERRTLVQREHELVALQSQLEAALRHHQSAHEARAKALETEFDEQRSGLEDRVRREMESELAQVAREKQEWQQRRQEMAFDLQQQQEDLHQQREQFGEHIEAERARLRDELEKRHSALLTEQNNLQRRYRFQFEHLTRSRDDLERELREFRREQQLFRTERLRILELHRLRRRQLETIRARLHQQEDSLAREVRIVERSRAAADSQLLRLQQQFQERADAAERDLAGRRRAVAQQESAAADLAARLDERSQRLIRLRSELDQSQAEILEQRLILEEVRAHSSPVSPAHAARLEQVRNDVARFFDGLAQRVAAERTRLEAVSAELNENRQQLRRDRAELEACFARRQADTDAQPAPSLENAATREVAELKDQLAQFRDQWKKERREAERTIRELLDQLTAFELSSLREPVRAEPSTPNPGRSDTPGQGPARAA